MVKKLMGSLLSRIGYNRYEKCQPSTGEITPNRGHTGRQTTDELVEQ
jgi:hypothetical protein